MNRSEPPFKSGTEPLVGAYSYDDCPPDCDDLYFVKSASGHCKIGRSGNIPARLKKLRTASPFPLELVLILKGHGWQESVWHAAFKHERSHLEWFRWGRGLQRAIVAARRGDEWIATLAPPPDSLPATLWSAQIPFLIDQAESNVRAFVWGNYIADLEEDAAATEMRRVPPRVSNLSEVANV